MGGCALINREVSDWAEVARLLGAEASCQCSQVLAPEVPFTSLPHQPAKQPLARPSRAKRLGAAPSLSPVMAQGWPSAFGLSASGLSSHLLPVAGERHSAVYCVNICPQVRAEEAETPVLYRWPSGGRQSKGFKKQ